jgi:hypothetical protein
MACRDEASITVIDARIHPLAAKQGPDDSIATVVRTRCSRSGL